MTYVEKSLFAPEGVYVMSRERGMGEERWEVIREELGGMGRVGELVGMGGGEGDGKGGLRRVPHD